MSGQRAVRAFTLIELMVVVAIGAIISMIAAQSFSDSIKRRRVTGEANTLSAEITNLRILAVSRGLPVGLCLRLPTYVNSPYVKDNAAGGRTRFLKSAAVLHTDELTMAEATLDSSIDRTIDYTELSSFGATALEYGVAGATKKTVTLMFDKDGVPTLWEGNSCDATDKTSMALPKQFSVTQRDRTVTTATFELSADGQPTGLL